MQLSVSNARSIFGVAAACPAAANVMKPVMIRIQAVRMNIEGETVTALPHRRQRERPRVPRTSETPL